MSGERWSLDVDGISCLASGICTAMANRHFAIGSDGHSRPIEAEIDADPTVIDAAESCPAEAITVTDLATGAMLAGPE